MGTVATLIGDGSLLAIGMLEMSKQPADDISLLYPTALLYSEMQVYAIALREQYERIGDATKQMDLSTAEGDWLDFWGRVYFAVGRYPGEYDNPYRQRLMNELIRPTQNNVALAQIISLGLGVGCRIVDSQPLGGDAGRFKLQLQLSNDLSADQKLDITNKAKDLLRRYKAAGTDFEDNIQIVSQSYQEAITATELATLAILAAYTETLQPAAIKVGAGWKIGTPGLKIGPNDAIKEQAVVTVLNYPSLTVSSQQLIGG